MTNRERYRKTFGALHASRTTGLEVSKMKQTANRIHVTRLLVTAACLMALLVSSAFAANAATDGALAEYVTLLIDGQAYQAQLESGGEEDTLTYSVGLEEDDTAEQEAQ